MLLYLPFILKEVFQCIYIGSKVVHCTFIGVRVTKGVKETHASSSFTVRIQLKTTLYYCLKVFARALNIRPI